MAAKRRRKRNANPLRQLLDGLAVVTRFEIVGLALVLVSVFTLLSLLTGSRGSVTGFWIDLLRAATGDGVAGVPLLTGFLGLWMVLHVIDGSSTRTGAERALPILPWRIPTGLLLIFLAYITAITLWLPSLSRAARIAAGGAGGALGLFIANLLENGLPGWGAWTLLVCSALLGLSLVSGRRLWESIWDGGADMALDGWESLRTTWRETRREGQQMSFPGFGNGQKEDRRAMSPLTPPATPLSAPVQAGPAADDGREAEAHGLAVSDNQLSMLGGEEQLPARNVRTQPVWELPQLNDMLDFWDRSSDSDDLIRYRGRLLEETLALFGVPADFEGVNAGPTVTQYLIRPGYIERMVRGEDQAHQGQGQQDRQSYERPCAGAGGAHRAHRGADPGDKLCRHRGAQFGEQQCRPQGADGERGVRGGAGARPPADRAGRGRARQAGHSPTSRACPIC